MKTYIIEYYLPKQSRLFSEPQRLELKGKSSLARALDTAKEKGYEIIAVYQVTKKGLIAI